MIDNTESSSTPNNAFPCDECTFVACKSVNLRRHCQRMHSDRTLTCPSCPKTFTRVRYLRQHIRIHNTSYPCDKCSEVLASKSQRRLHIAKEHKETFHCDFCSSSFLEPNRLKRHIEMTHEKVKKFFCYECPFGSYSMAVLERHNLTHTGERPFICDDCGKLFRDERSVKNHKSICLRKGKKLGNNFIPRDRLMKKWSNGVGFC